MKFTNSFYVASGGSDDWSHQSGISIVYTIELRDRGSYGFLMPESAIKDTCEENIAGIEAVFNHTRPHGTWGQHYSHDIVYID